MAAEIGTQKVIEDHSTIGLVITTDGTISDIPRSEYKDAEQRVIDELLSLNKPFIVLLNSIDPKNEATIKLANEMSEEYKTPVIPVNCLDLDENDISYILKEVLFAFPVKEINICMPKWLNSLDKTHWLKSEIFESIRSSAEKIHHVRDINGICEQIAECEYITKSEASEIDLGKGSGNIDIKLSENLFYKILGEQTGAEITCDNDLLPLLTELIKIREKYEKIENALAEVEATGYGIVMPDINELTLNEPEIVKQGGKYGVRLRASAPSVHLLKTNISVEVNPIVGSEKQSEELLMFMMNDFEEDPSKIWNSNIFGKSLHEIVNEGLHSKLYRMPVDARLKLQETLERIINEGCGGLICFIL